MDARTPHVTQNHHQDEHNSDGQRSQAHIDHDHGHEADHESGHPAHADHTGHEQMFRRRFWVCLVLSIPVLLYSPMLQEWFGFTMPSLPASQWIAPLFSTIIFLVC